MSFLSFQGWLHLPPLTPGTPDQSSGQELLSLNVSYPRYQGRQCARGQLGISKASADTHLLTHCSILTVSLLCVPFLHAGYGLTIFIFSPSDP